MFNTLLVPSILDTTAQVIEGTSLSYTINENVNNMDLWAYLDDKVASLSTFAEINVEVPEGVVIGSSSGGTGFTTGDLFPSGITLVLDVNGVVTGYGGRGGAYHPTTPGNGTAGGLGMIFTVDATITGTGTIQGGGGGGGGGTSAIIRPDPEIVGESESIVSSGGGGGGQLFGRQGTTTGGSNVSTGSVGGTLSAGGTATGNAGAGGAPGDAGSAGDGTTGGAAGGAIDKDGNTVDLTGFSGTTNGSVTA